MKNKLSLGLVAVACVALLAGSAMGGSVFFSTAIGVGKGRRKNNFAAFGITIPSRKAGTDGWWSGDT